MSGSLNRRAGPPVGKKRVPVWLTAGLLADLAACLLRYSARSVPGFADRYTDVMNPLLVCTLGRISGVFPFSLAELLLYLIIIMLFAALARLISSTAGPAGSRNRLFSRIGILGRNCFCLLSALFLLFELNEDVYFYRTRFAVRYGLERDSYSTEELAIVCRGLSAEINEYAPLVRRDKDGHMIADKDLPERMRSSMRGLGEIYPELSGWYPRPKYVFFSTLLSRGDITGVYSMFTVEANLNRDMPQYNLPFTVGHELSHLKSFESEKEANFLGYLACMSSEDPDVRYSGAMMGWVYCGNELHKRDYDLWKEIYSSICPEAQEDLKHNNEYWDRYKGKVSETVQNMNDSYLKAQGLKEGTLSYDLVTDMIVSYELQKNKEKERNP